MRRAGAAAPPHLRASASAKSLSETNTRWHAINREAEFQLRKMNAKGRETDVMLERMAAAQVRRL
ncbi:MAG: hypothetical protein ACO3PD_15070, partial [Acidimicrobiales bacterium]